MLPELAGMSRPCWRPHVPALWLDATTMQLGDDVIVDRVTAPHVEWLRLLDGARTAQEISGDDRVAPTEARRLLRALRAAGALVDAARLPPSMRFGSVAQRDAAARRWDAILDRHRDGQRALRSMEARDHTRVSITGDGSLRDAIAAALEAGGLAEVATAAKATVVILADAHHPDVPAHVESGALDLPHLHVCVRGGRATVGPLVVPGVTGCLRCAHLHRRDRDRTWPLVAVQWSHVARGRSPGDSLMVSLAAAHAVHLVRSWTDDPDQHERWANLAIDLRLGDLLGRCVPRPPHPLCGCRWMAE
jgi:bacteriocin biosynthesis cyclodehydratase domain-containing protein